jgi:hypothetical protein
MTSCCSSRAEGVPSAIALPRQVQRSALQWTTITRLQLCVAYCALTAILESGNSVRIRTACVRQSSIWSVFPRAPGRLRRDRTRGLQRQIPTSRINLRTALIRHRVSVPLDGLNSPRASASGKIQPSSCRGRTVAACSSACIGQRVVRPRRRPMLMIVGVGTPPSHAALLDPRSPCGPTRPDCSSSDRRARVCG